MIGRVLNSLLKPFDRRVVRIEQAPPSGSLEKKKADYYWEKQQYLERSEFKYVLWIDRVYQQVREVPGHVVELGVAYGRNAILFSHLFRMHAEEDVRKYVGFDTFDGYNETSLEQERNLSDTAWKDNSKQRVEDRLKMAKVASSCTLVAGDIMKTVPEFTQSQPNLRIALLYVDCNAYDPALFGMESLLSYMSPGGIICIDEKKQGGETRALIEFCEKHGFEFRRDASPFSIPAYTRISKS